MDFPKILNDFYPFYERSTGLLVKAMRRKGIRITPAVASHYINKQREPNAVMIYKIADFFSISCDYLINSKTKYLRHLGFIKNIEKSQSIENSRYSFIQTLISILSERLSEMSEIDRRRYDLVPFNVNKNIRLLREQCGVKGYQLAKDFGYKYAGKLNYYELRGKNVEISVIDMYSKYFSVSAHQIVSGEPLTVNIKNSSLRDNTLKIDRNYSIPQIIHLNAVIEEILK